MYLAVEVRGAFQQAPEVKCSSLFADKFSFLSALIAALYPGAFWDIRDLRNDDGDGNGNVKKEIGFMRKATTLHVHHAFWYISLQSLHNYDVK